jgi:hypothetical protein
VSEPLKWLAGEVKTPPMSVEARREMSFYFANFRRERISQPSVKELTRRAKIATDAT